MPLRRPVRHDSVALRPVTVGRHLAVRACLGCVYVEGEGGDGPPPDLAALPDDALVSFVDHAVESPPARYADRAALVALASAVWEAWQAEVGRQMARGKARQRLVVLHTGMPAGSGGGDEPPPPEIVAAGLTLAEWAVVRDLPLWEVVLVGLGGESLRRFREFVHRN